ncbi:hypothetical protein I302_100467 [Kwoniella bestiolae CBS 10118]|uniref:Uncharacterized protein n=1 Tax=Kwoniella bestiolae CBS 10118 TaxID=1296100 RepID=A0A1B9G583_9TREE|nr:hypothetical protein I302_03840 [Kwoniella bestiolae CBS 10118]OCF26162.1 hypothetical protein I302_03840 [Kwoniella bestiolae CBS 10118]
MDGGDDKMADHDDLLASIIYAGLDSLGAIEASGITTTGFQAKHNVSVLRGFMASLGKPDLPISYGLEEYDPNDPDPERLELINTRLKMMLSTDPNTEWQRWHQVDTDIRGSEVRNLEPIDHKTAFSRFYDKLEREKRDGKIVVTTGAQTIHSIMNDPELGPRFRQFTKKIILQSGAKTGPDGRKYPDGDARNAFYHITASEDLFKQAQDYEILTDIYTKFAATACAIEPPFVSELAETGHKGAQFLHEISNSVDAIQLFDTLNDGRLFTKKFTLDLLMKFKTVLDDERASEVKQELLSRWSQQDKSKMSKEEYTEYLSDYLSLMQQVTKNVPYDSEAMLGALDDEYLEALNILKKPVVDDGGTGTKHTFRVIGSPTDCGVNVSEMRDTIIALAGYTILNTLEGSYMPPSERPASILTGAQATRSVPTTL